MGWMRTRFIGGVAIFCRSGICVCPDGIFQAPYAGYKVENVHSQGTALMSLVMRIEAGAFCATGNSIDKIRFVAGVNDRVNKGYVKLTVKDGDDKILYDKIGKHQAGLRIASLQRT